MKTFSDFIFLRDITVVQVVTQIFVFVTAEIMGWDFNYPAPVTSY